MYKKIKNYLSTLEGKRNLHLILGCFFLGFVCYDIFKGHISWATVVQTMFFTYEFCGAYAAHKKVDIFNL